MTDKLKSYLSGVELAFGSDALHKQGSPFNTEASTNPLERFQGSLKDRTKILRGLKKPETARHFLGGWLIHYNFFRPHQGIKGKTPAEAANIKFAHKDRLDLIRSPKETAKIAVSTEPKPILRLHHPPMPRISSARMPGVPLYKPPKGGRTLLRSGGHAVRQRRGIVL